MNMSMGEEGMLQGRGFRMSAGGICVSIQREGGVGGGGRETASVRVGKRERACESESKRAKARELERAQESER